MFQQILDGLMLGDGFMRSKNNPSACLGLANKSAQWVHWLGAILDEQKIEYKITYPRGYPRLDTRMYSSFLADYKRWYRPCKAIPDDLSLTPTTVLHWYLGDGHLTKVPKGDWITYGITLHTECFCEEDQYRLAQLLRDCGIPTKVRARISHGKDYQIVAIGADGYEAFFAYIGDCPFTDFIYKWPLPHPERSLLTNRQKEALLLRQQGLGVRRMGKAMGISSTAAWVLLQYLRKKLPDEPSLKNFKAGPR